MNHLDEFELNEYLDGMLDEAARQQAAAHLANCADCRAALADLQAVFFALSAVAEVELATDLSARITAALAPEPSPWLRPFLLAQIAAGVGMVIWLWPTFRGWLALAETAVRGAISNIQPIQLVLWERVLGWETAVLQQIQLARPAFDLASGQWVLLIGLSLIIWLAGNRLLLSDEG